MKILQRNLNRVTFVVWEMKRNVSVVRLVVVTRNSGPPASQPVSCLTCLSADLSVIWLRVPTQYGCCSWVLTVMCEFTQDSWKMYRYTVEERVFIVRECTGKDFPKYGAPGSIMSGRKWWPLPAHVMMSLHFSHNERTPVQISLQYLYWCQNY